MTASRFIEMLRKRVKQECYYLPCCVKTSDHIYGICDIKKMDESREFMIFLDEGDESTSPANIVRKLHHFVYQQDYNVVFADDERFYKYSGELVMDDTLYIKAE